MLHNPQQLKKIFLMSSGAAIILCAATLSNPVCAETVYDGFYLGATGGIALTPDFSNNNIAGIGLSGTIVYDKPFSDSTPYNAGVSLGYKYGPFKYEIEGIFMHSNYEKFSPASDNRAVFFNLDGSTQAYGGLANIIFNFDQCGNSGYFYLGLGGGYVNVEDKLKTRFFIIKDTADGFAMQAIVGYAYNVSQSFSIGLDYRYFVAFTPTEISDEKFQNHLFNLGFNVFFG